MRWGLAFIAFLISAAVLYHHYFYPPSLQKRALEAALLEWNRAVAGKDRTRIAAELERFMAADAAVVMEVSFITLPTMQNKADFTQTFNKPGLIAFIDQTIAGLADYAQALELDAFSADGTAAEASLTGLTWGDRQGTLMMSSIPVRYSGRPDCTGEVQFDKGEHGWQPVLKRASCRLELRILLRTPEALGALKDGLLHNPLAQP